MVITTDDIEQFAELCKKLKVPIIKMDTSDPEIQKASEKVRKFGIRVN